MRRRPRWWGHGPDLVHLGPDLGSCRAAVSSLPGARLQYTQRASSLLNPRGDISRSRVSEQSRRPRLVVVAAASTADSGPTSFVRAGRRRDRESASEERCYAPVRREGRRLASQLPGERGSMHGQQHKQIPGFCLSLLFFWYASTVSSSSDFLSLLSHSLSLTSQRRRRGGGAREEFDLHQRSLTPC